MKMPTPENLATIRVVYLLPDSLTLCGVPYEMRPGQSPKDIQERYRGEWIYLGGPGWFGDMTPTERALTEGFIARMVAGDDLPVNPHEWCRVGGAQ